MLCIVNKSLNISDYMPQIIGIFGTILGTVLGWLLRLISDNIERTYISVHDFCEQKSKHNEYAYIVTIFIYNASHKQQCIRNARLSFTNWRGKELLKSIPGEGTCNFETIRFKNTDKKGISMLNINSYSQSEYILSDLIIGEDFLKLYMVRKIFLLYEDKKNRKKKMLINSNFKITSVENTKWERFL